MATHSYPPRGEYLPHLRAWRLHRALSQRELGELAKDADGKPLHIVTISRIESQRTPASWETINRLAKALRITRRQLIDSKPNETEQ